MTDTTALSSSENQLSTTETEYSSFGDVAKEKDENLPTDNLTTNINYVMNVSDETDKDNTITSVAKNMIVTTSSEPDITTRHIQGTDLKSRSAKSYRSTPGIMKTTTPSSGDSYSFHPTSSEGYVEYNRNNTNISVTSNDNNNIISNGDENSSIFSESQHLHNETELYFFVDNLSSNLKNMMIDSMTLYKNYVSINITFSNYPKKLYIFTKVN